MTESETVPREGVSTPELIRNLTLDLQTLAARELEAARLEVKAELRKTQLAVAAVVVSGVLAVLAGLQLTDAAANLVAREAGWSVGIAKVVIGAALALVAGLLAMRGKFQLADADPTPTQTAQEAQEDAKWLKQEVKSAAK
ncbi:MAG: phage holin family protein [Myxococcota bacterium]